MPVTKIEIEGNGETSQSFPQSAMVLEAYEGSAGATSSRFSVSLLQGSQSRQPHVYSSSSPDAILSRIHPPDFCSLHGGCFCNRSISWVEFGQAENDHTRIRVSRRDGLRFPQRTRVLPLSLAIRADVSADGSTVTLLARGSRLHMLLQHGPAPSCDAASSFSHSMLIWVGGLDPSPPTLDNASTLLRFGPGEHYVADGGVLQLPAAVDTILLERGAWVMGRINVTRGRRTAVKVVGHGIFEGSRFTYHGGSAADSMRFVEPQLDRPLLWDGPSVIHPMVSDAATARSSMICKHAHHRADAKNTLAIPPDLPSSHLLTPQGHAAVAPPNSSFRCFRMLGWLFNEDGLWLGPNSSVSHSFIRTNDDSIRMYAGEVDHWLNTPAPRRGERAKGASVREVVIAQMFNGAAIQLGWESAGVEGVVVDGLDLVSSEWYDLPGNATRAPSNALLSLVSPQYDTALAEHHRNITLRNVRVDSPVGSIVRLGLYSTRSPSSLRGLWLCNVTVRHPLSWLNGGDRVLDQGRSKMENTRQAEPEERGAAAARPGDNFVYVASPSAVSDVRFAGVSVAGVHVRSHLQWGMSALGEAAGATAIRYQDAGGCL